MRVEPVGDASNDGERNHRPNDVSHDGPASNSPSRSVTSRIVRDVNNVNDCQVGGTPREGSPESKVSKNKKDDDAKGRRQHDARHASEPRITS